MAPPKIKTPRGMIISTPYGKAQLVWNTNFQPKWQKRYSEAQKFVDNAVLSDCDPLIPFKTGMLRDSGLLGTVIGSGLVSWIAPYARYQYYLPRKLGSQTGPLRGPFWFHRAKKAHLQFWLAGAKKLAGGKK